MKDYAYNPRDVWGADEIQRIVERNSKWLTEFIVAGVKAVMKDGRPLYTEKIPEQERLANLLAAPPQFWEALQAADPETAAQLVASVIKAREGGKIPPVGPRAAEVVPEDGLEPEEGAGTAPAQPLPSFIETLTDTSVAG